jgi:murein DD-endopeptidase MepM/ murein hydrolase activator NlpD
VANPLKQMRLRGESISKHPTHNMFGMVRKHHDGRPRPHQGWDIEAPNGTPVFAIADGEIHSLPNTGAYGRQIILQFAHGGAIYYAQYAHLSRVSVVVGQQVRSGDQIGATGHSGNASSLSSKERHLHFEVRTVAHPGTGLAGRVDPGMILGYAVYSSETGGQSGN